MRHFTGLAAIAIVAIVPSMSSFAQAQQPAARPMATADDASSLTCADFNAAAAQAHPGSSATSAERRRALDAQDYIGNGMVWIHGYLSGRAGAGASIGKLDRDWIASTVAKIGKACASADQPPGTRLVDLAQKP